MKKLFVLTFFVILTMVAVSAQQDSSADTDNEKTNPDELIEVADKALKVDIVQVGQEYPSKRTAFQITIMSEVDSGRATIQWYWPTNLYKNVGETKSSITITSGSNYVATKYFNPIIYPGENAGVRSFTIGVKVSALVYEQNYLTIYKKTFFIDSDMQILPITDIYKQTKTTYDLTSLIAKIFLVSVGMLVVSFILSKFINYINAPDKEK